MCIHHLNNSITHFIREDFSHYHEVCCFLWDSPLGRFWRHYWKDDSQVESSGMCFEGGVRGVGQGSWDHLGSWSGLGCVWLQSGLPVDRVWSGGWNSSVVMRDISSTLSLWVSGSWVTFLRTRYGVDCRSSCIDSLLGLWCWANGSYDTLLFVDCVARDSSSSAIVASAYLDIYEETGDRKYYDYAIELLDALSTDKYLADPNVCVLLCVWVE